MLGNFDVRLNWHIDAYRTLSPGSISSADRLASAGLGARSTLQSGLLFAGHRREFRCRHIAQHRIRLAEAFTMSALLFPFMLIAAVGFVSSAAAHIASLAGVQPP